MPNERRPLARLVYRVVQIVEAWPGAPAERPAASPDAAEQPEPPAVVINSWTYETVTLEGGAPPAAELRRAGAGWLWRLVQRGLALPAPRSRSRRLLRLALLAAGALAVPVALGPAQRLLLGRPSRPQLPSGERLLLPPGPEEK